MHGGADADNQEDEERVALEDAQRARFEPLAMLDVECERNECRSRRCSDGKTGAERPSQRIHADTVRGFLLRGNIDADESTMGLVNSRPYKRKAPAKPGL
jgi:hypothetical protein